MHDTLYWWVFTVTGVLNVFEPLPPLTPAYLARIGCRVERAVEHPLQGPGALLKCRSGKRKAVFYCPGRGAALDASACQRVPAW